MPELPDFGIVCVSICMSAVCVLQCVAVCCSVLQCVAVCCSVLLFILGTVCLCVLRSVLQCVAVYCIVLHVLQFLVLVLYGVSLYLFSSVPICVCMFEFLYM